MAQVTLENFHKMMTSMWQSLAIVVNGNLTFGDGTTIDNVNGAWVNVTAPVAPNTDFTVNHNLNRIPVGYWVMQKDRACDVYTGSVAATLNQLTLRATVASAVLRIFIICALLGVFSLSSFAQTTLVSGTVTAADGQTWNNGTFTFTFVPSPRFNGTYFLNGVPFNPTAITGTLSGTGTFSNIVVPSNTAITPSGTFWTINVCPDGSTSQCSTSASILITGASQNITSSISPPALLVNCGFNVVAYRDSEVSCTKGGTYYNSISQVGRVCQLATGNVCNTWANAGGTGGGGPSLQTNGVVNSVQTILNLLNGTGVGITADGFGGVTVTNTAPLQTSVGPQGTAQASNGSGGVQAMDFTEVNGVLNSNKTTSHVGPNPTVDVTSYNSNPFPINLGAPAFPGLTATCTSGNATIPLAGTGASLLHNGDGVTLYQCGAPITMSTPAAPTVTPAIAVAPTGTGFTATNGSAGSVNTRCYVIVARDQAQGKTVASPETCVTSGSAILGGNPISATSGTRSGQTVTVLTSAHTMPIGCSLGTCGSIFINGTSDEQNFSGWFPISSVPDATHFTYVGGLSSLNGATTSFTGGTFIYFNSDHLVLPAYGSGMWQYGIYEGATGAETWVGVSIPNISGIQGTPSANAWDWYGATYSGGLTRPPYWPNTPPTSSVNDSLTTTIASGGGTSTIVVNNAPLSSPGAGTTVLFDNCPTAQAANAFSNNFTGGGGMTAFNPSPNVPAVGQSYIFNSYCSLSGTISQSMPIMLVDTMQFNGQWYGNLNPNTLYISVPSFAIEGYVALNVNGATPGIYMQGQRMQGVKITAGGNSYIAMLHVNLGTSIFEDDDFIGGGSQDINGILFYDFANIGSSFGFTMHNVTMTSGPGGVAGSSFTPLLVIKNNGENNIDNIPMARRGIFFAPNVSGGHLTINQRQETQSLTMPWASLYYNQGGVPGGWIKLEDTIEDTGCQPIFSSFATTGFIVSIDGTNGGCPGTPLVSGTPIFSLTVKNSPLKMERIGQNVNVRLEGPNGEQHFKGPVILGSTNGVYSTTAKPAAPTCSTATAGPPFTQLFTSSTFEYAPVYSNGGIGTFSGDSNACTSDGATQQVTVTIPSAIQGAIGYVFWKGNAQFGTFTNNCAIPGSNLLATLVFQNCGVGFPNFVGGGPAGVQGFQEWADVFNLTNYADVQEIAAPANPAAGYERWFANLVTHQLSCLTSSGSSCASSGGAVAPPNLSIQYDNSGVPGGVPVPTSPDNVQQVLSSASVGGVGTVSSFKLSGVKPRDTVCPSNLDTILATDRAGLVRWNDASACAVTLPQAGSGSGTNNDFTANFVFLGCNLGVGTATITPTTSGLTVINNGQVTTPANLSLSKGQCAFFYSDNTNYTALQVTSTGLSQVQTNTVNNTSQTLLNLTNSAATNGITLTVTNTSGGIVQLGYTGTLNNSGLTNSATTVNGQTCTLGSSCTIPPGTITIANAGTTGTTVNTLTKLTGAPSTAVITATTDTGGVVGITTSGAGTTGSAVIQLLGSAPCVFDGATIAGDYVQISSTTVGNCHDVGASYPSLGQVIGRVLTTNGAGGTFTIDLFPAEITNPSSTNSVKIANGTAAMGTSAISSGACATVVTVSATGVATTDVVTTSYNSDPTAVTGYGASATGAVLTIYPYPTTNNVNFKVCNSTASSITPSALTLNWKVVR